MRNIGTEIRRCPTRVFHLLSWAVAIVMGLAAVAPDPRAPDSDVLLDAESAAERVAATACLLNAKVSAAAGRAGASDLN